MPCQPSTAGAVLAASVRLTVFSFYATKILTTGEGGNGHDGATRALRDRLHERQSCTG